MGTEETGRRKSRYQLNYTTALQPNGRSEKEWNGEESRGGKIAGLDMFVMFRGWHHDCISRWCTSDHQVGLQNIPVTSAFFPDGKRRRASIKIPSSRILPNPFYCARDEWHANLLVQESKCCAITYLCVKIHVSHPCIHDKYSHPNFWSLRLTCVAALLALDSKKPQHFLVRTAVTYCRLSTIKCQRCVAHAPRPAHLQKEKRVTTDNKHVTTFAWCQVVTGTSPNWTTEQLVTLPCRDVVLIIEFN